MRMQVNLNIFLGHVRQSGAIFGEARSDDQAAFKLMGGIGSTSSTSILANVSTCIVVILGLPI